VIIKVKVIKFFLIIFKSEFRNEFIKVSFVLLLILFIFNAFCHYPYSSQVLFFFSIVKTLHKK